MPTPKPPRAEVRPHVHSLHGTERIDEFAWLRDDTRQSSAVLAHLEAENAYTESLLEPARELRETLSNEMVERLEPDDAQVPARKGKHWYLDRFEEGLEYPLTVRRQGAADGPEEVLIDQNERASGCEFYDLGNWEVSDDGTQLAMAEDTLGRGLYTLRIKDIASGAFAEEAIEETSGDIAWSADGRYLFYIKKHPETLLPYRLMRHGVGSSPSADVPVYEEADPAYFMSLWRGKSGDYVYLHLSSTLADEVHLIEASAPLGGPLCFLDRQSGHEYAVEDVDGRFFLLTNDQALNFRVVETNLAQRNDRASWREIAAHDEEIFIHGIEIFRDFLVVSERVDALRRLQVYPLAVGDSYTIDSTETAFAMFIDDNLDIDSETLRYGYTSLTTPYSIYDFDLRARAQTLKKRQPVRGSFDPANYRTERIDVTSEDGVRIPVSLVYRRVAERSQGASLAERPLLVYGYGAYGASMDPVFSSARLSLLDRGFIYAIAHVRGGQERGRRWYETGRMFAKQNSFDDFVAATKALLERGYGDPARTFASGGSAGGLLMGTVINQAPYLFRGVVADVPFVDVVTTMLDESIPLTTGEFDEWGDPKIEAQFHCMLSYSPYDNVTAQSYPNLLVTTGLHDSQVQYWEPAKWVARLRDRKTDDNVVLLYTDMDSGHGGASGRFRQYAEVALRYAFLLWLAADQSPDEVSRP